jgi:hypothetical protein
MSVLTTADLMLLRAASDGDLAYFHTVADAAHLYRWRGADVDRTTMLRIAALIDAGLLTIVSLQQDSPVQITADGDLAALKGALS